MNQNNGDKKWNIWKELWFFLFGFAFCSFNLQLT